jgi:hypothetical protein
MRSSVGAGMVVSTVSAGIRVPLPVVAASRRMVI